MNILIYNFEKFTFDDLESFSAQVDSVIFFAFSHSDVKITIINRSIDKVIFRVSNENDLDMLLKLIEKNKRIEFFVLFSDFERFKQKKSIVSTNSNWYDDNIKLTELSTDISTNFIKEHNFQDFR